jgi:hypothetical protein
MSLDRHVRDQQADSVSEQYGVGSLASGIALDERE